MTIEVDTNASPFVARDSEAWPLSYEAGLLHAFSVTEVTATTVTNNTDVSDDTLALIKDVSYGLLLARAGTVAADVAYGAYQCGEALRQPRFDAPDVYGPSAVPRALVGDILLKYAITGDWDQQKSEVMQAARPHLAAAAGTIISLRHLELAGPESDATEAVLWRKLAYISSRVGSPRERRADNRYLRRLKRRSNVQATR